MTKITTGKNEYLIECGKCYSKALFIRLSGLGEAALYEAREKGLKTVLVGRRLWIRGDDFHEFLGALPPREQQKQ